LVLLLDFRQPNITTITYRHAKNLINLVSTRRSGLLRRHRQILLGGRDYFIPW